MPDAGPLPRNIAPPAKSRHAAHFAGLFAKCVDLFDTSTRIYMRLCGLLRPRHLGTTVFGAEIECDIRDFIQRRIYFFRIFEPNLTSLLLRRLKPGDCFIDIGANIGYFSMLASTRIGPTGKVIAVEAAPSTFQLLRANLDRNACANVDARNVAVTAEACHVDIVRTDPKNIGANQIKVSADSAGVAGSPLMDILGADARRVSVIKIDIEGSEAPVLAEIAANLDRLPPHFTIISEIGPESAPHADALARAGFRTYGLPNNYSIGYHLVREYLRRSHEGDFSVMNPVSAVSSAYRDYVFEK